MSIGFFFLHDASVRDIRLYEKGGIVRLLHNTFTHLLVDSGRMNSIKGSNLYYSLFKVGDIRIFSFLSFYLVTVM